MVHHKKVHGRPPKEPMEKINVPVRALVTIPVMKMLNDIMEENNLSMSDVLRLGVYHLFVTEDKLFTEEMHNDPTWDSLKEKGYIY